MTPANIRRLLSVSFLLIASSLGSDRQFFARHNNPLTITPDGSRLCAVNSAEGRISVFAMGQLPSDHPVLIAEIPVGLLPISVRLRNEHEAWVVNELSDSISIVDLAGKKVTATLTTGDEPADIAFAAGKAFVTCSRDNAIQVFDPETHELLDTIPLQGIMPRSLAVSPDGSQLYTSFLHTSNGTTILPRDKAPPQDIPENINPDLPAPPKVGKVVPVTHPEIDYHVLDHDLATIDTANHSVVSYRGNLGTNMLHTAVAPDGRVLIANSEARNLIALETELRGRFTRTRVAIIDEATTSQLDLNADPDLTFPAIDSSSAPQAMAQVMAMLPATDGSHVWLAAMGSDRLAKLNLDDQSLTDFIDLRSLDPADAPRSGSTVRGPRGLALHPALPRLFVLNRLSHTLSMVDTNSASVLSEIPLASHPDLAPHLKKGRALLFDARLSANGTVSCATCHIDLERDGMAWDLGNPTGDMLTIKGALLSLHLNETFVDRELHPMKGPLMTQTLIGLADQTKLHWRGDKPDIQSFNSTFPNLLAGELQPDVEMDNMASYLLQLRHHPNPHLKLDRNLPEEINGGNPTDGIAVFTLFDNHCSACHLLPSGTSNNLDVPSAVGSIQPLKDAPLRTTYQRTYFNPTPGADSLTGFGLGSDGSHHELPLSHPYSLHILDDIDRPLVTREKEKRDLTAFLLAFDTGTAPAIGHTVTLSPATSPTPSQLEQINTLEAQAQLADLSGVALVVRGVYQGASRAFHFESNSGLYHSGSPLTGDLSASDLISGMLPGDSLTFLGVPLDEALVHSVDRDGNGTPDEETDTPLINLTPDRFLRWPADHPGWYPLTSPDFLNWSPLTQPLSVGESGYQVSDPSNQPKAFYRLERTW